MQERPITKAKNKICVVGNGCPENRMDVAFVEKLAVSNGWQATKNWHEADVILFNACGQTQRKTDHSLNIIKEIQNFKTENQQLIVWGCLPKIDPELLRKVYQDPVFTSSEHPELQIIQSATADNETSVNYLGTVWPINRKNAPRLARYEGSYISKILKKSALKWEAYLDSHFNLVNDKDPTVFYIKVSTGCQSDCAYCAIRKSRGLTKSKPVANIVAEFQQGLQEGFEHFSLMGTDLGAYGSDINSNLVDLLKELIQQKGIFRISLRNVNPGHLKKMIKDFTPILKSSKIHYIELPAESGSNRILKLMNRNYTVEEYKSIVNAMRRACPNLIVRTQVMAGFPTETEQEFQETMKLLDDVIFDFVEVYEFSARPGTIAEKIEPKVPDKIKRSRFINLYKKALLNRTSRKIKNILLSKVNK